MTKLQKLGARLAVLALVLQLSVPTALGMISNTSDGTNTDLISSANFCITPGTKVVIDPASGEEDVPQTPHENMVLCIFCFACQTGSVDLNGFVTAAYYASDLNGKINTSKSLRNSPPHLKHQAYRHATRAPPAIV